MKKVFAVLYAILVCCAMLTGCGDTSSKNEYIAVYSFSGENEQFTISNGIIVLTDTKELFYVSNLEEKPGQLSDITAFTITFYFLAGNEENVLLSNSIVNETSQAVSISGMSEIKVFGDIPSISGTNIDELQNNLYCELQTTNLNGGKDEYLLHLTLTEITD